MKKIYKSAIIGCGNIAGNYDKIVPKKYSFTHAGAYNLLQRTKLISICDNNTKILSNFSKKWKVSIKYNDYKKMLKNEKIDILSICTPTNTHYEIIKYALKFSNIKAIFLEKPSTFKSIQTKKIIEQSKNKIITVNYFRRWNNSFLNFKKIKIKKNISKIKKIHINYTKGLYVSASHQIDLMRFFFGEPKNIKVIKKYKSYKNDAGVDFILIFNPNIHVSFNHIPNLDYVFFDIQFFLENKIFNISQRGQKISEYIKTKDLNYNIFNMIIKKREFNTQWKNCTLRALKEIVSSLDNNIVFSSSNLYNAYRNTQICEKIYNYSK